MKPPFEVVLILRNQLFFYTNYIAALRSLVPQHRLDRQNVGTLYDLVPLVFLVSFYIHNMTTPGEGRGYSDTVRSMNHDR